jgi:oleate hydratase
VNQVPTSRWVSFTVPTKGNEFLEQLSALTGSELGFGELALKDSGWLLSLTIFHQPDVIGQPARDWLVPPVSLSVF